jgi:phosphatidylglycerol---prolipoprotein diacylglyceryl transferase
LALQFPNFDPVAIPIPIPPIHIGSFTLGPFAIKWYALAYIAGILLGWRYAVGLVRNGKLWGGRPPTATPLQIDDLILWITFGVIVGGRIGYVCFYMLVNPDQRAELFANPFEVFEIWNGGMAFHGALVGVAVAMVGFVIANLKSLNAPIDLQTTVSPLWSYVRQVFVALLGLADIVAACEPIGQCFGRLANFVNGELWGRPTNLPWGMVFCNDRLRDPATGHCPADLPVPGVPGLYESVARHPSQLYEAALEGVVLFLLLRWATHRAKWLQRPGAVTGLWLIGYGAIRIALENVRNPDLGMPTFPLGLTMGMILSVPMIAAGGFLLWRAFRQPVAPAAAEAA